CERRLACREAAPWLAHRNDRHLRAELLGQHEAGVHGFASELRPVGRNQDVLVHGRDPLMGEHAAVGRIADSTSVNAGCETALLPGCNRLQLNSVQLLQRGAALAACRRGLRCGPSASEVPASEQRAAKRLCVGHPCSARPQQESGTVLELQSAARATPVVRADEDRLDHCWSWRSQGGRTWVGGSPVHRCGWRNGMLGQAIALAPRLRQTRPSAPPTWRAPARCPRRTMTGTLAGPQRSHGVHLMGTNAGPRRHYERRAEPPYRELRSAMRRMLRE